MEKEREQHKGRAMLEVLGELVLTFVCLVIGFVIVGMFDINIEYFKSLNTDFELLILIGLLPILVSYGIAWLLVRLIKRIFKRRQKIHP